MVKLFFQLTAIYLILHIANFDVEQMNNKKNIEEFQPCVQLNNDIDININNNDDTDSDSCTDCTDNGNSNDDEEVSREIISRGGTKVIIKNTNNAFKSYMDYRTIKNKSSMQYKLQHSQETYTDSEGFRKINDMFMIAVGSYFNMDVGQTVEIELSNGSIFKAIIGEAKDNRDTDSANLQGKRDGSVVEFIIDKDKLNPIIRKMGDCSYSKENNFKGNVISVEILEQEVILCNKQDN